MFTARFNTGDTPDRPTRSVSEGLYRPSAKSNGPPTRSASEGLYQPSAKSSAPPTQSAGEGLYQPSAKSSGPPTQSASEGLHTTRVESEHPLSGGDSAAVIADGSCGSGQMSGAVAGASGWGDGQPSVAVRGQRAAKVSLTMIVKNEEENLPRCLASVERILPSLKRANIAVRWTDLIVRHTGYLDPEIEAQAGAEHPAPQARRAGTAR